jgi:N-acetylmuramoyl-L-alanine amidase
MTLLAYLLKVIVVSAILFGYYRLFLRNKRFHHYNRFFLLSALLLSVVLPFIRIPLLYQPENPVNDAVYRTVSVINTDYGEDMPAETIAPMSESVFTLMNSIYLLYAIGVLFLMTLVFKSLLYIRTLRKRYPAEKITSLRFYNTNEPGTPFSFFRSIFWNEQLSFNSREGQQIFRHELFHVQHQHSADRLLSEVLAAIFWFNPFFHLIKKELKAIHEFLADQFACSGSDRYAYATLLVQQALESGKHAVTNHFFQNHIKRRIAMITQFQQSKYGYWSRVMVLPVSLLLFCFITLYAKKPASGPEKKLNSAVPEQPLTVLVDVGHGGTDPGAMNEEGTVKEKDLTLQIARKIQQLAAGRNINVVMTRDGDYLAGNKANTPEALQYVTSLISDLKPDAVISVHIGAAGGGNDTRNGIDFFITGKNISGMKSSRMLGEFLAASMDQVYTINPNLRTRKDKGIWVLDQEVQPAVLIECGYLTNPKDLAFISNPANQEKIAAAILDGVVNFKKAGPLAGPVTDTIPDKIKKQKELLEKEHHLKLEQLKRQLQEHEEVMKKAQRVELESLKKQMIEQELLMKEREQNKKDQTEQSLMLKKEMLNRQNRLNEEAKMQQEKMIQLMKEHEVRTKEDADYRKESEAHLEILKQKMRAMELDLQNKQRMDEEMMKSKMREIESRSEQQREESQSHQEHLRMLKKQLMERESMLKRQQHEELQRVKEEMKRNEKERKEKEDEIRSQRERERDKQKENERQESSYNLPAKFIQDEDELLKNVIRQYLRNMRYPEIAIQNGAQGSFYFSVIVDQKGFFNDFKIYNKPPDAKQIRDLVIVTDKLPYIVAEKELSDDEKAEILKKEMARTTVKNNEKPVPHPESRQYYFRAVFKMNNLKESNTFLIRNSADWETKVVAKPVNQNEFLLQDTIPAKRAAKAKAAAKARAKSEPYDKQLQKPAAPAKLSKEPTDPDNHKAHKLSEPRNLKGTKDIKPATAEKKKLFTSKPAKLFENKRAKLFADKPARAKAARKATEKPRKVHTKPAKEDGSEQIPDQENEENYSEISVTGDK